MSEIKFDAQHYIEISFGTEKPIVNIIKGVFNSSDVKWVSRLANATLILKTECVNLDNTIGDTYQQIISLVSYITPYHRQPVLEINYFAQFGDSSVDRKVNNSKHWKTSIEINEINFTDSESFMFTIMNRDHIISRVDDWEKRVVNLFNDIRDWIGGNPEFKVSINKSSIINEEMMQTFKVRDRKLDTLDLYYKNNLILTCKPKGLWILGANGRIDIISAKGSYMIVDVAEQFELPQWYIYSSNKKEKNNFNQKSFQNIVDLIIK